MKKIIFSIMVLGAVLGCTKTPEIHNVYNPNQPENNTPSEGDTDDPTVDASEITVCSFNLRIPSSDDGLNNWTYRKQGVIDFVKATKPDMIGVQELRFASKEDLVKGLSDMYELYHINRETGSALANSSGEAVGIFLLRDRFKILDKGFFWLCDTPDALPADTGWGGACRRITVWVKAQDLKNDGKIVWFSSTHFDHMSTEAQVNSAPLCISRFKTLTNSTNLKGSGDPIFFMGDLNTEYASVCVQNLASSMNYARLSLKGADSDSDRTYNGFNTTTNKIIDHIFFGGDVTPVKYWVDRNNYCNGTGASFISDHYPVLFKVKYK